MKYTILPTDQVRCVMGFGKRAPSCDLIISSTEGWFLPKFIYLFPKSAHAMRLEHERAATQCQDQSVMITHMAHIWAVLHMQRWGGPISIIAHKVARVGRPEDFDYSVLTEGL